MERLRSGNNLKKNNFSFAVCHITLLSTALECSVRWYREISKGNMETLQDFSFLCMNISLQHTVTLKLKSSQEQISPETEKFHATCSQKPTPTSLHSFYSECASKWIRAACLYLTAFTMCTWSTTGAPGAAGSSFTTSSVIMRKGAA